MKIKAISATCPVGQFKLPAWQGHSYLRAFRMRMKSDVHPEEQ
jgi:hypothetical protein